MEDNEKLREPGLLLLYFALDFNPRDHYKLTNLDQGQYFHQIRDAQYRVTNYLTNENDNHTTVEVGTVTGFANSLAVGSELKSELKL